MSKEKNMLDTIDQQIIKLLQISGKATIKDIANKPNYFVGI